MARKKNSPSSSVEEGDATAAGRGWGGASRAGSNRPALACGFLACIYVAAYNNYGEEMRLTRRTVILFFDVASLTLSLSTSAAVAAKRPPIVGIAHVALQVGDMAKARAFYGDLLGYEEPFRLFREDGTVMLTYFKINDRQFVEILPDLPSNQDERLSHFALETTDIESLRVYLVEKGITVPDKIKEGRDKNLTMTVTDPDGHSVEFVQYQPDSPHSKTRGEYLSNKRISDRMLHVGITVKDANAADRFYKEVLGMSEIWRGGMTSSKIDWINMRVPEGTDYVEYMLIEGKVDRRLLGVLHHLALQVPDIQKALETIRQRPSGWDPATVQAPQVGRNNRWQLNLYDPDGTRTELMEPFTIK